MAEKVTISVYGHERHALCHVDVTPSLKDVDAFDEAHTVILGWADTGVVEGDRWHYYPWHEVKRIWVHAPEVPE